MAKYKVYTMTNPMTNVTERPEWQALAAHEADIAPLHMRDLFAADPERYAHFSLSMSPIFLDFSRNRITQTTIDLLIQLAKSSHLSEKIAALFSGKNVNYTENRPALHSALRDKNTSANTIEIEKSRAKCRDFVTQILDKKWLGSTGKPIKHAVNIGIGGSYLGPMMTTTALKDFAVTDLDFHFISSVDAAKIDDLFQLIDGEQTLFIISSKSFTTLETLTNANTILAILKQKISNFSIEKQVVAVTANIEKALQFGLPESNIFKIWDWVGGRYSIWSAIGLPLMLQIGNDQFQSFLDGAYAVDQHFQTTPLEKNIPVILALLSIWYQNFFGASAQAIIPYSYRLRYLIHYIQQADMESNGKSVNSRGETTDYATGPIIFGEEGCNGQHAYHQLLHQGNQLIPADFILIANTNTREPHHDILVASGLSQAHALMRGKTYGEAYEELQRTNCPDKTAQKLALHRVIPGNKPSNIILLSELTPYSLGALLAIYEHKIFVSGVIWDINSFDQFGVELGKELLPNILNQIKNDEPDMTAELQIILQIKRFQGKS